MMRGPEGRKQIATPVNGEVVENFQLRIFNYATLLLSSPAGGNRISRRRKRQPLPHNPFHFVRLGAIGDFPAIEEALDHRFGDLASALAVLGEESVRRRLDVNDAYMGAGFVEQTQTFAANV